MTYTEIENHCAKRSASFLLSLPVATQQAWRVLYALHDRKGFDWWFDDLEPELQDEIFAEIEDAVKEPQQ